MAWIYNAARETIDIGGNELERSKKFRDIARTGRAAIVIDDLASTDPWRPRGYAIWRLGAEDQGIWNLMHKPYGLASPRGLTALAPAQDVDFDGTGEVLHVSATPAAGRRAPR